MFSKKLTVAGGLTTAFLLATTAMIMAASHREAPGITEQPKIDGTDFYMFRSYQPAREGFVTFIANYQPIQAPYGGPNYFTMDSDAIYEIHVDNNGDAVEDITFQFQFTNTLANNGNGITLNIGGQDVGIPLRQAGAITVDDQGSLNETETYTVKMITGDRRSGTIADVTQTGTTETVFTKPIDYIGTKTLPDYATYANSFITDVDIPGCPVAGRVFVGQRAEAFAVNLGEVFDLVNFVPIEGDSAPGAGDGGGFPGGITQDRANDDLVGEANVTSIALEVPIACLTAGDEAVIGAWTTASLPQAELRDPSPTFGATSTFGGAFVQKSRLSGPLVNELVIGLKDKDLFNAAEPIQDGALAFYVTNPTFPALLDLLFRGPVGATDNIAPSNIPRNDLVAAFLTGFPGLNQPQNVVGAEMLRLNTAIPPTLRANQQTLGLVAEDLAGFPNGRRPGDDAVDIVLRVAMGALCHPVPLGAELGIPGAVEDTPTDLINLGLCAPGDAPVGTVPFTDGAPISAAELQDVFPYLNTPIPGSPN